MKFNFYDPAIGLAEKCTLLYPGFPPTQAQADCDKRNKAAEPTNPAFTIPPTSTKLTFKYMLYPFDKKERIGATTTGKRRDDNSLPAGTVPDNALEKSTFEVTVNH